ncbi:hypothetical protein GE061_005916 [Apolygus lucorum]|uniref:Uncharacterized protein n=1 Tax=Apolygus lucorum TaxID=248454 RepID=A0A8S9WU62_APOLU|nr:hypothetical protein GE061_005916 [Apolygus lucorum]
MNKTHLNKGSAPSAAVLAYVEGMTAFEGDVAGQMIPRDLGGTGNETYNFIPMNCFISGLWRLVVVQPVYSLVNEGIVVKLSIVLTYDNATSTRPSKIAFSIDDSKTVKNSSLDNPVPMFVCDHPMIPQSQTVRNETTITTITTVTISNTTVFVPNPLWGSNFTNKGVDFFKTVSSKDLTTMPQTQGAGSEATNEDKHPQTTPLSTYETTTATKKPPQRNRRPIKILKSRPKTVTSSTTTESGYSVTVEDYYAKETRGLGTEATNQEKYSRSSPWSIYVTTTTKKPPQRNRRPFRILKSRPKTVTSSTTTESDYSENDEEYYAEETQGLGTEATHRVKNPLTTTTKKPPWRNRPPSRFHKSRPKATTLTTTENSDIAGQPDISPATKGYTTECFRRDWLSAVAVSVCVKN